MQLPQHIIDHVGTLMDEGWSDEAICNTAVLAMHSAQATPPNIYLHLSKKAAPAARRPDDRVT